MGGVSICRHIIENILVKLILIKGIEIRNRLKHISYGLERGENLNSADRVHRIVLVEFHGDTPELLLRLAGRLKLQILRLRQFRNRKPGHSRRCLLDRRGRSGRLRM